MCVHNARMSEEGPRSAVLRLPPGLRRPRWSETFYPVPVPRFSHCRVSAAGLLLALVFSLTGCLVGPFPTGPFPVATRPPKIEVQYTSVADEPLEKGLSFHIVGKPGQAPESDLYFGEVVRFVTAALEARGLHTAPSANRADITVELQFGMLTPRPAPGGAPPATVQYEKHLSLTAHTHPRATRSDAPPKALWSIRLSATDESDDLRKYLALLVAASIDQLGVESFGLRSTFIGENDRAIDFVRKG